jgi:hypothetical protein
MRAMQATRYSRQTGLMPSQASQLPPLTEVGRKKLVGFEAAVLG